MPQPQNQNSNTNLLDLLREAKRGLTPEQQHVCDDFVIGILSLRVPEQIWRDTVEMAARLARKKEAKAMAAKIS